MIIEIEQKRDAHTQTICIYNLMCLIKSCLLKLEDTHYTMSQASYRGCGLSIETQRTILRAYSVVFCDLTCLSTSF